MLFCLPCDNAKSDNTTKMMISTTDKTDIPENKPSQPPMSVMNLLAGYAGTSVMVVTVLDNENLRTINL